MSEEKYVPRKDDLNSMLYWWPRVSKLSEAGAIPMPRTLIYEIPSEQLRNLSEENMDILDIKSIKTVATKIGYPLFMRTDLSSAKHSWDHTCFVPSEEALVDHIHELLVHNWCVDMVGLWPRALIFREYIPMYSLFKAFSSLPISKERRYFVRDGKVVCHHPYWPEAAIKRASAEDWKAKLAFLNEETATEVEVLSAYARCLSRDLPGYWSVDFCFSMYTRWYFIDAAVAEDSYHPSPCPNKLTKLEHGS